VSARAALAQSQARRRGSQAGLNQATSRSVAARAAVDQARAVVKAAHNALAEAQARLAAARAGESGARTVPQQMSITRAQNSAAAARIRQARADVLNARLQLSYTSIEAPVAGVVSRKTVEPGQFVQPGQLVMALVPLSNVWVVANFKETQIEHVRPGQPAVVTIDTYPGRRFRGRVDSIGAAAGVKFSLLPPENATGNFVKVVQRIPVKIVFDERMPSDVIPRPGVNVVASVRVGGG
jgi:membrane fusion protein (multidrug efflux system)